MSCEVKGVCVACGHRSLFLGSGGYVTCSIAECPNPTATSDLLTDHRGPVHVVTLRDDSFTVEHPLIERAEGRLDSCSLHHWVANLDGPPRLPGRYLVLGAGEKRWGECAWQRISD